MATQPTPPLGRRDKMVAAICGLTVAIMVGAAYAAVPFYNWFCRATGYNGTTQVATAGPVGMIDRKVTVRFDANVGPGLPWRFEPEQTQIELKLGQVVTINYKVINEAARPISAQAAYNVTPLAVGIHFNKINCFCFTEQTLKAGETREMPVVFYVDPAMIKDSDTSDVKTITLSYTFYKQPDPVKPVADGTPARKQIY